MITSRQHKYFEEMSYHQLLNMELELKKMSNQSLLAGRLVLRINTIRNDILAHRFEIPDLVNKVLRYRPDIAEYLFTVPRLELGGKALNKCMGKVKDLRKVIKFLHNLIVKLDLLVSKDQGI